MHHVVLELGLCSRNTWHSRCNKNHHCSCIGFPTRSCTHCRIFLTTTRHSSHYHSVRSPSTYICHGLSEVPHKSNKLFLKRRVHTLNLKHYKYLNLFSAANHLNIPWHLLVRSNYHCTSIHNLLQTRYTSLKPCTVKPRCNGRLKRLPSSYISTSFF